MLTKLLEVTAERMFPAHRGAFRDENAGLSIMFCNDGNAAGHRAFLSEKTEVIDSAVTEDGYSIAMLTEDPDIGYLTDLVWMSWWHAKGMDYEDSDFESVQRSIAAQVIAGSQPA